ncbi:MAG: type II toxin-antitoxin system VapC family toxin [Chloroflexi bacterium]|nr:type II toxin-antitoxin system VapC family toxin [Chloroflexota bacterium]
MLKFLLDTNIVSETLRPKPDEKILARLEQHQDEIALAAVSWHELWYGAKRLDPSRKRTAIEDYLVQVLAPTVPVLPYDDRAAEWHAAERARLTRSGKPPPFADGQIAAIAQVNDLILVTLNTADYSNFEGLAVADWSK